MKNCNEKKIKMFDKGIKYTCTQCEEDYIRVYHEIDKVYYCKNIPPVDQNDTLNITNMSDTTIIEICMAKNCKICKSDDNYFCDICEFEDYVVNNITGACIKRSEAVPAITWKDIFRLEMNSVKEINGRTIKGPKLHLKGITHSKINSGHAFLIYLVFKIKQPLRNLGDSEDKIRIKAICEVSEEVEENKNEANSVEYECIGDSNGTNLDNTILDDIDVGNDNSNLKELKSSKDLSQLESDPIIVFIVVNPENQTSNDYNFNFRIDGKIDDNLNETEIKKNIEMNEISDSSNCIFKIEKDKKAYLSCTLNIEKYKDIKVLTFKPVIISNEKNEKISLEDLNQIYLINEADDKEETIIKNHYNNNDNKKSKTGVIVGTIILVIVVVALALITTYICFKKKSKLDVSNEQNKQSEQNIRSTFENNYNKTTDTINSNYVYS